MSCLSFKSKKELKDSVISALEKMKIKYRSPQGRILIENFKENFKMEIKIAEVNDFSTGYVLKFKRILGNLISYSILSRKILKRVEL